MQFLIDSATETPASLRHAALMLNYWAALTDGSAQSSINGDGGEITLTTTETHTIGDISHTVTHAAAKRPAAPPIGPAPTPGPVVPLPPGNQPVTPVVHPERHPDAPAPEAPAAPDAPPAPDNRDPNVVFGKFGGSVPAGTNTAPSLPTAPGTATAPATVSSAAPAAGNAPPAPTTGAGAIVSNRDSAYIPWDARVHSDTRKKNADGTWRFRRNLDEAVKAAVMAELKAAADAAKQVPLPPDSANAAPAGQPTAAVAGNLSLPAGTPPVPQHTVPANTVPAAPDAPAVTLPAALPVQPAANVGVPDPPNTGVVPPVTSFRELMTKINVARAQGKLTQEQVDAACRAAKVDSITALAAQPALVPEMDRAVNVYLYGVAA